MNNSSWIPFTYRSFYDVPRLIRFSHEGVEYLLDCPFDESLDEYGSHYTLYRVTLLLGDDDDWESWLSSSERIGTVRVADVQFDKSLREHISLDLFRHVT